METFLKFFYEMTKYENCHIIHNQTTYYDGINNKSFFVNTIDGKKWQIKIASNNSKSINNEIVFLKHYWNLEFFFKENIYIKQLKNGEHFEKFLFLDKIESFATLLKTFHIEQNMLEVDYNKYLNYCQQDNSYNLYKKLLLKHQNEKIVISHNDINFKNLLIDNGSFFLIDFEWTKNNYEWFDIINLIREENFKLDEIEKIIQHFDYLQSLDKTIELLFINTFFSYSWTLSLENSKQKSRYLKIVEKQLKKINQWMVKRNLI